MAVLVTGGAGYIGSHTVVELLKAGQDVVVVDNFCNSHPVVLERIAQIAGRAPIFHELDVRDGAALAQVFSQHQIDSVIHFAGLKAVGESVAEPLRYYRENLGSTFTLLETMARHDCFTLVFSSSATVYGEASEPPFVEDAPLAPVNPYGRTKLFIEEILRDVSASDDRWRLAILRYFNPVGAHPSGRIGEDPKGIPNNLFPFVAQVAVGTRPELGVFGDDYPTPDGTGVRDYIHVVDLARGHLAALEALAGRPGVRAWNLGSGHGSSVLEVVDAWSRAVGRPIPYTVLPRRGGDNAWSFAEVSRARDELGFETHIGLDEMCADHWRWQSANPRGYAAPDTP